MSRVVKLAVIPGDGIGPEVIAEAEKVLDAATAGTGIRFDKTHSRWEPRASSRPATR